MSPLSDLPKPAVESGLLGRPALPAMAKEKFYPDKSVLLCTPQLSSGLRFHVEDEVFAFYTPAKMRDDPQWVDVTSLYTRGLESPVAALNAHPGTRPRIAAYAARLARLRQVLDRDFHEEKITGEDKGIDVVVEIFNLVNSGGTKLSKGDLALAKKCAQWPEARAAMRTSLEQ
jgi:hypothetical protein